MKSIALLTTLLGATATATPLHLRQQQPKNNNNNNNQIPLLLHHPPTNLSPVSTSRRALGESQQSTKGGAILHSPSTLISSSTGVFRIPSAQPPTSGPTGNNPVLVYASSFWIGIDGGPTSPPSSNTSSFNTSASSSSCGANSDVVLRAGIDIFYDPINGGTQNPFAWFQHGSVSQTRASGFSGNFSVATGDLVRITVRADGDAGERSVKVENFGADVKRVDSATALQTVTQTLPGTGTGTAGGVGDGLCRGAAAWVVEDFPLASLPDVPTPLANFTEVRFGAMSATAADGTVIKDAGAVEVFNINLDAQGGQLTDCKTVDANKVKCRRTVGGV